jgi:hypothetical protein
MIENLGGIKWTGYDESKLCRASRKKAGYDRCKYIKIPSLNEITLTSTAPASFYI